MKLRNSLFLAKANLRGNTKTTSILATTIILVVTLTLISSISNTILKRVEEYKADSRAKIIGIHPTINGLGNKSYPLNKTTLDKVIEIEHIESISIAPGMMYNNFETISMDNNSKTDTDYMKLLKDKGDAWLYLSPLIGNEEKAVIAGDSLKESPVMSCLIPDKFYPFDDSSHINEATDFLDGEKYIGKTLTIKPASDPYIINYNIDDFNTQEYSAPALEYKLKIVGVYRNTPTTYGSDSTIFVSAETGNLMEQSAVNACNIDIQGNTAFARWWRSPEYHDHFVTVDDYDNLEFVYGKLDELKIQHDGRPFYSLKDGILEMAVIFKAISFILTLASMISGVIIMIHSSANSLINSKKEIGLLKAIGYKNKQIFSVLFYEQLIITLKGFLLGSVFSCTIIVFSNYINGYTSHGNTMLVVNLFDVAIFSLLSLVIVMIVPLSCQMIMLAKLKKIQPREAMN